MADFVEADGEVHIMNPSMAEYTLCGDAFDLGSDEPGYEQKPTKRRTVTCPKCAKIVIGVRGIRTAHPHPRNPA